MSSLNNFQQSFREVEDEIRRLKEALRVRDIAAQTPPPRAQASRLLGKPVMQFTGGVEPFVLTARQLTSLATGWEDVRAFLDENSAAEVRPSSASPAAGTQSIAQAWTEHQALAKANAVQASPAEDLGVEDPGGQADDDEPSNVGVRSVLRDRPNYGISRIDQPEKANHGWYVRITKKGHTEQKFFADKSYGGRSESLDSAREFRDFLKEQILGIPRISSPASLEQSAQEPSIAVELSPIVPSYQAYAEPEVAVDEDQFKI